MISPNNGVLANVHGVASVLAIGSVAAAVSLMVFALPATLRLSCPAWRSYELVTLHRPNWLNNLSLPEPIGNIPPAEAGASYHAALDQPAVAA